jgi:Lon-like protease
MHVLTRRTAAWAAGIVAGIALILLFAAWMLPTSSFLFLPNEAQPLTGKVVVEGGKTPDDRGGIYYVDVTLRRARWLERLVPFTRPEGATMVPEDLVLQPGSSFDERHQAALAEMARSEKVAAAVALRAAGYDVAATARGAIIETIDPSVPAARVLEEGDTIVEAAGRPVRTLLDLRDAMTTVKPGESVVLRIRRDGKTRDVTVRTVAVPADPSRAFIGIHPVQAADISLPIDVDIDLGNVGGPSAGLPFALDVLQELGRNVDRGYRVAATGELELDGSVSPIGGIRQKVIGVRESGADVFLVPAGDNAAVASRYAGNLRVIPVENFQQALHALATLPPKG